MISLLYTPPAFKVGGVDDMRSAIIGEIQARLNATGAGPVELTRIYDLKTASTVKQFQTRNGLVSDGVVGFNTWTALFGFVDTFVADTRLLQTALSIAISQIGIKEVSINRSSNRGIRVDEYNRDVGSDPNKEPSWCAAFVYWCFTQASRTFNLKNPLPRTGSVIEMWKRAPAEIKKLPGEYLLINRPKPGWIWLADHGEGFGHMGIIRSWDPEDKFFTCIDGNTNEAGSREGNCVAQKIRRASEANLGFIDLSLALS